MSDRMSSFHPGGTSGTTSLLSTAGAVPIRNEKGELSMQKVKVTRYIAGKRPDFAETYGHGGGSESSSSSDDEDDPRIRSRRGKKGGKSVFAKEEEEKPDLASLTDLKAAESDPRWKRLQQFKQEREDNERDARISRHRHIEEPELLSGQGERGEKSSSEDEEARVPRDHSRRHRSPAESSGEEEEELSDQEYDRRRELLRQRAKEKQKEEELLSRQQEEEEQVESSEEEDSEYEDYSDSEDETMPRLKPVFVRKRDRITLQESEKEQKRLEQLQLEQKKAAEERKTQSAKIVETIVKQEVEMEKKVDEDHLQLDSVCTDDENEEMAYEAWKIRELKRVKRDRDEREMLAKEKAEWEKIHNMNEEERRAYLRANPKIITNKQTKSKYKFLQKYFHRGVFFLDEEQNVFKQDFAQPTLEDHFDKTILPKVMQVKDFGKAGRTKWTHLANEDTTDFQSAWTADSAHNLKFFNKHGGGVKEVFDRPAAKKKKNVS